MAQWKLRRISDTQRKQHENEAKEAIRYREDEYCRRELSELKKQARADALAASALREKTDWVTVSPATLMQRRLSTWDDLSKHEQRLENQFYKAVRELRQWRKAKANDREPEWENEASEDASERMTCADNVGSSAFAPLPVLRERLGEGSAQHASNQQNEPNSAEPSPRPSPGVPGEGGNAEGLTPLVENEATEDVANDVNAADVAGDAAASTPLPVRRERPGEGSAQHASNQQNEANCAEPSPRPSPGEHYA